MLVLTCKKKKKVKHGVGLRCIKVCQHITPLTYQKPSPKKKMLVASYFYTKVAEFLFWTYDQWCPCFIFQEVILNGGDAKLMLVAGEYDNCNPYLLTWEHATIKQLLMPPDVYTFCRMPFSPNNAQKLKSTSNAYPPDSVSIWIKCLKLTGGVDENHPNYSRFWMLSDLSNIVPKVSTVF